MLLRRELLADPCCEDPDPSWADEFLPDDIALPKTLLRWLDEIETAVRERAPDCPAKNDALVRLRLARRFAAGRGCSELVRATIEVRKALEGRLKAS